jgi:hypothetical protein
MPRSPRGSRVSNFAGHWACSPASWRSRLASSTTDSTRKTGCDSPSRTHQIDRPRLGKIRWRTQRDRWLARPKRRPDDESRPDPPPTVVSRRKQATANAPWVRRCLRTPSCSPTTTKRPWRTCSSNLQQQMRGLVVLNACICGWLGTNDVQRCPLRHFASKGLGVRVPLAPPCDVARHRKHLEP